MDSGGASAKLLSASCTGAFSLRDARRTNGCPGRGVHRRGNRPAGANREKKRMNRKMQIGFTQRLQLNWLDKTAGLLLASSVRPQIKSALTDLLKDQLSVDGTEGRGSREKTITILLKTWVTVPKHLEALRGEGLGNLPRLPAKDHLSV